MIAAVTVNVSRIPSARYKNPPTAECVPSNTSREYPSTVGGRTSGKVTSASTRLRPGNRLRASNHARPDPAINAISVAAVATVNESLMGNQLITGISQHDTRKQRPDNYPAEVPLKIGGGVVRTPDAMAAKIDLVPQLDDLVNCRDTENEHRRKERREFGRQSITMPSQHIAHEPDDDRANQHLYGHVRELVVMHWSKLAPVHAEEISECIDLQREKNESQE